jgi:hypothetical protein
MKRTFELGEEQRQAILLAIAQLSLTRPGWLPGLLLPIAQQLGGAVMFENFRALGSDEPASVAAAIIGMSKSDEESDGRTIEVMARFGGSFVKALAEAARRADPINRERIKTAFREYWSDYAGKHEWLSKEEPVSS